jgi:hypothetical protein
MPENPANYTTQLGAGLGMINETLDLLRLVEPGDNVTRLSARVVESGLFSRTTARRAHNIVAEMFAPRYFVRGDQPARFLHTLVTARLPQDDFRQLCFLHTARAQTVFADFVVQVYWPRYSAGARSLSRSEAESFIHRGLDSGRMKKRWSESIIDRVSGYVLGCCADFGLLADSGRATRAILPFSIRSRVALYLAYDLHFAGLSDKQVAHHPDWQLFGLAGQEPLAELKRLAHDGHLIVQAAADLVQISWKHRSLDDLAHALA